MDNSKKRIDSLRTEFDATFIKANIDQRIQKLGELDEQMAQPDFWNDSKKAGIVSKEHSDMSDYVTPWLELRSNIVEIGELLELNDHSILDEINPQIDKAEATFQELSKLLRYNGPYDNKDAIISIYAGAGGTDAQDWAEMLERMYLRWLESANYKSLIIERSAGDEAGIKSTTIEAKGQLAYGKLKNEHGVHRLVRLSPFNSDNLRQTSFAKVEVLPKIDQPEDLTIDDKDLKIDVYRAGGHGGQSVNTTDSAVRVTHLPTGVVVSIQNERSQLQNKETAMTILRSRLIQLQIEQHKEKLADLKGINQSAEWGSQIRNYVLHPYKLVKDLRTGIETSSVEEVLDGKIDEFIDGVA